MPNIEVTSQYAIYEGPDTVVDAYATAMALDESMADLVVIRNAVSYDVAIELCVHFATNSAWEGRLSRPRNVLHNEIPRLAEAEALVKEFQSSPDLPDGLVVTDQLEAPPGFMKGSVRSHTDVSWLEEGGAMVGPFAISLGVTRMRKMWSRRLPRPLTHAEMLGSEKSDFVQEFEDKYASPRRAGAGLFIQNACDLVLIPGAPHPTYHRIFSDTNAAVVSGYLIHRPGADLALARKKVSGQ